MVQPSYAAKEMNNRVGMYNYRVWNYVFGNAHVFIFKDCVYVFTNACLCTHVLRQINTNVWQQH